MTFSFNASLSGLNANANALNVVGNNIANANTIGFRGSQISFADIFTGAQGSRLNGAGNPLQIGYGVRTAAIQTNFTQGNLSESSSPLHAAIQGKGFFVVRNTDGTSAYTRAGNFSVNSQGYLVATNGGRVQGYMAQSGSIPSSAALTDIRLPIGQTIPPQTTTQATLRMNLNSEARTNSTFNAPVQVYDSRGTARTLTMTFTRQANGSFNMSATLDGNPAQLAANGGAPTSGPINFTFDANGNLTNPTSLSVIPDQTQLGGATLPSIGINLRETNPDGSPGSYNITSFDLPSAVASATQDGYAAGELSGATVDQNGVIYGVFTNGRSMTIGQYGVATFNSEEGLQRNGNNMFGETISSGQATVGAPGAGGRGLIVGGYVEQSNVNITNEFIELIEAQRGFQANSRVITSLNQTFQDLLQIV